MSVDFILSSLCEAEARKHGEANQKINLHCRSLQDGLLEIKDHSNDAEQRPSRPRRKALDRIADPERPDFG
jgi:hypothetical protein